MAKPKDIKVDITADATAFVEEMNKVLLAWRRLAIAMVLSPEERACLVLIIDGFVENARLFKAAPPDDDPVWEACANLKGLFESP